MNRQTASHEVLGITRRVLHEVVTFCAATFRLNFDKVFEGTYKIAIVPDLHRMSARQHEVTSVLGTVVVAAAGRGIAACT